MLLAILEDIKYSIAEIAEFTFVREMNYKTYAKTIKKRLHILLLCMRKMYC